jgi:hypothetical protein
VLTALGEENLSGNSDGEDDGTVRKDGAQTKRQRCSISQWDGGDSSDDSDAATVTSKRPRRTVHPSPTQPARKQRLATPPLASTTLRIAEARDAAAPPQVMDRLVCERHMRLDDLANRHGKVGERVPSSFRYISKDEDDEQTQLTQPYRPPPGALASAGFRARGGRCQGWWPGRGWRRHQVPITTASSGAHASGYEERQRRGCRQMVKRRRRVLALGAGAAGSTLPGGDGIRLQQLTISSTNSATGRASTG